jgi:hypothetical protein
LPRRARVNHLSARLTNRGGLTLSETPSFPIRRRVLANSAAAHSAAAFVAFVGWAISAQATKE